MVFTMIWEIQSSSLKWRLYMTITRLIHTFLTARFGDVLAGFLCNLSKMAKSLSRSRWVISIAVGTKERSHQMARKGINRISWLWNPNKLLQVKWLPHLADNIITEWSILILIHFHMMQFTTWVILIHDVGISELQYRHFTWPGICWASKRCSRHILSNHEILKFKRSTYYKWS